MRSASQIDLRAHGSLPRENAYDFLLFCQRNPKPCPVIEVLESGRTEPSCAPGSDLRTDLPRYRVFRDGRLEEEPPDVSRHWGEDLVAFLIGCSFSFEEALFAAGVPLRHVERGCNVPMYRTSIPCAPAGRFAGPLVVSMRPIPAALVPTAVQVTVQDQQPSEPAVRDVQYSAAEDPVQGAAGLRQAAAAQAAEMGSEMMGQGAPALPQQPQPEQSMTPIVRSAEEKVGRNEPCWCGSGKKFKKCHGAGL